MRTLEEYRQVPYERVWRMCQAGDNRYYVVSLVDIPAIAGDGRTRDEAVEDLREAFDEFVAAWLADGKEVPRPRRAYSLPADHINSRPWEGESLIPPREGWAETATVLVNDKVSEFAAPRLAVEPQAVYM